jgi:uncharacterized protein (UPF0548 family)
VIALGRLSKTRLLRLLDAARQQVPSYPEVGATAGPELPNGYRHDYYERRIGGPADFNRAAKGLSQWEAHRGAGASIIPPDPVSKGATILVVMALGPLQMIAPCRIIDVSETEHEFRFTYGTLPGHPERGEESFSVERRSDGTYFGIVAFSRPQELTTRLSGPIGRGIQKLVTGRYLTALADYVQATPYP